MLLDLARSSGILLIAELVAVEEDSHIVLDTKDVVVEGVASFVACLVARCVAYCASSVGLVWPAAAAAAAAAAGNFLCFRKVYTCPVNYLATRF